MRHFRFGIAAGTGLMAVLLGGLLLLDVSGASAAGEPPWEPDANAAGTLSLYDATGNPILSGKLTDHPFAKFAKASATGRSGDTKATLLGATPDKNKPTGAWTAGQLSASTTYPNAAAPAAVVATTSPVVTIGATDGNLQNLIAAQPNTQTDPDYANIYQLRIKTSGPGVPPATQYFTADLKVDTAAGTFTVIYPTGAAPSASPSTSASASPSASAKPTPNATASPNALSSAAAKPTAVASGSPRPRVHPKPTTAVPATLLADPPTTTSGGSGGFGTQGGTSAGSGSGAGSLPRTGAPLGMLALFGATLLYLGVVMVRRMSPRYQGRHCAR